jgi:hypothetical protein
MHDVNCIAGILTLRRDKRPRDLDKGHAIFVSDSGLVVQSINAWYRRIDQRSIPPIIHIAAISSIAWLKHPEVAMDLQEHELVAACSAAMQPSKQLWSAFIGHLHSLQDSGELSSEEAVAVITHELTFNALASIVEDQAVDAATTREIVQRVRDEYRREGQIRLEAAKLEAEEEVKRAIGRATEAEAEIEKEREAARAVMTGIEAQLRRVAHTATIIAEIGILMVLVIGSFISLPGMFSTLGSQFSLLGYFFAVLVLVLALLNMIFGWHLKGLSKTFEDWLFLKIRRRMIEE